MKAKKYIQDSQKKVSEKGERLRKLTTELEAMISDIEKDSDGFSDEKENSI